MTALKKKTLYDAAAMECLEIIEAIRHRVGMYLGSADDDGIAVAAREVIDNAVDEHMNGHGDLIAVKLDTVGGTMSVEDSARGIPVDEHPQHPGKSALEVVMTVGHSGGKFRGYGISGGLHGIGLKAVTATSKWIVATVWRDGKQYQLRLENGHRVGGLVVTDLPRNRKNKVGTRVEFAPDVEIFRDATSPVPSVEVLRTLLQERAYLNSGLTLTMEVDDKEVEVFREEGGIESYVRTMAGATLSPTTAAHLTSPATSDQSAIIVDIAVAWTGGGTSGRVMGFCNGIMQPDGGTHVQGLKMALPSVVRAYAEANKLGPGARDGDLRLESADCFEGVTAIVSVKHTNPVFRGQAKTSLSNSDAQGAVQRTVNSELARWMEEHPKEAKLVILKATSAAKARVAAAAAKKNARKQDGGLLGMRGMGKLKDCASRDSNETELFILEGESAGGSAGLSRDRNTQAIYSLKGKPLNTWEKSLDQVATNAEMADLIVALGTSFHDGMTEEEVEAAMAKLRYSKIIILADADIDGCLAGDTLIRTDRGPMAFTEVVEEDLDLLGPGVAGMALPEGGTEAVLVRLHSPRKRGKDATLLAEVIMEDENGKQYSARATPDHLFLTNTGWVAAGELQPGELLVAPA